MDLASQSHELSEPATEPDIMNDPAFDPNTPGKQKGPEEPDTCRICRGEGSPAEPLFYPCKCSGSIKFVHQDCLMEWLSHSQKKHCELCKTSFRFTKLYDPQMPSTVPLPIFLRQAAVHTMKSLVSWLRWNLVIFVWLGWVPWCMRTVWRGFFWVGDGGWISAEDIERQTKAYHGEIAAKATSPASVPLAYPTDPALNTLISTISNKLWTPISQSLNFTSGEPKILRLARYLYGGFIYPGNMSTTGGLDATNLTAASKSSSRSPSLLSDIRVLRNLTRSNAFNNLAIDVLEGQLITLLVVVIFILIFLIREWVVQQQPAIAAAAVPVAEAGDADPGNENQIQVLDAERARQERQEHAEELLNALQRRAEARQGNDEDVQDAPLLARRIHPRPVPRTARPRIAPTADVDRDERDTSPQSADESSSSISKSSLQFNPSASPARSVSPLEDGERSSQSVSRPAPDGEILARANHIRRTIEEQAMASEQNWPGIDIFMDVWKRADSDPAEVLRIIEAEGRVEELGWIVSAMNRLEDNYSYGSHGKTDLNYRDDADEDHPETQPSSSNSTWSIINEASTFSDPDPSKNAEGREVSWEEARLEGQELPPPFYTIVDQSRGPPLQSKGKQREVEALQYSQVNIPGLERFQDNGSTSRDESMSSSLPELRIGPDSNPNDDGDLRVGDSSLKETQHTYDVSQTNSLGPPEGHSPNAQQQPEIRQVQNFSDSLQNWLWGEVQGVNLAADENDQDDEHVVQNEVDEAPFVRIAQGQLMIENNVEPVELVADPEVLQAAADAGVDLNDAEAIEDREDIEGIMELVGAQGPIAGLIQNGMFSATLISLSFLVGVWVPYVAGKVALVFMANPVVLLVKLPLRWSSIAADVFVDACIFVFGCVFVWIDTIIRFSSIPLGWAIPLVRRAKENRVIPDTASKYAWESADRLAKNVLSSTDYWGESDIPVFSIVAHESLRDLEGMIRDCVENIFCILKNVAINTLDDSSLTEKAFHLCRWAWMLIKNLFYLLAATNQKALTLAPSILHMNPLRITIDLPERTRPLRYELAHWSTRDRVVSIIVGYFFFFLIGAAYLKIKKALREKEEAEGVDGSMVDVLNQAGGVIKVILIISIEMILFPLYCGMLLDVALLPLFENATLVSRLRFTFNSPATSIFVHWFVGTCYMFHFALFVSMCRRILRTGVLYFIRDPDDPSFHPVRDVLERNVYTQLRKIAFSAMVYGALVLFCLGAVTWSISFATDDVFPIHWSSSEPVLEFPIDLLVYNFVMPIAVTLFKPSKGLNALYEWWFRKSARWLRLTHFLFNERNTDEEGYNIEDSTAKAETGDGQNETLVRTGRFVRAPASDQVRLPKGSKTFVEVDENNNRTDGQPDNEHGIHGRSNKMFSQIYIPPHFRFRISLFIFLLWLFAAVTGVSCTILPLLFGRYLFARILPLSFRINDIYAFSIGAYILGGPLYFVVRYHKRLLESFSRLVSSPPSVSHYAGALNRGLKRASRFSLRGLRLVYFYAAFSVVLPALFAILFEAYLLIPAHTYFSSNHNAIAFPSFNTTRLSPSTNSSLITSSPSPMPSSSLGLPPPTPHTIHFVQDWTLGVLALKVLARILLSAYPAARPSLALRALVNPGNRGAGWFNPDIRLATRGFILPAMVVMVVALTAPVSVGYVANAVLEHTRLGTLWGLHSSSGTVIGGDTVIWDAESRRALVYRFSYPVVLVLGLVGLLVRFCVVAVAAWRAKVRDEVYLIGERLHNFGEKKEKKVQAQAQRQLQQHSLSERLEDRVSAGASMDEDQAEQAHDAGGAAAG